MLKNNKYIQIIFLIIFGLFTGVLITYNRVFLFNLTLSVSNNNHTNENNSMEIITKNDNNNNNNNKNINIKKHENNNNKINNNNNIENSNKISLLPLDIITTTTVDVAVAPVNDEKKLPRPKITNLNNIKNNNDNENGKYYIGMDKNDKERKYFRDDDYIPSLNPSNINDVNNFYQYFNRTIFVDNNHNLCPSFTKSIILPLINKCNDNVIHIVFATSDYIPPLLAAMNSIITHSSHPELLYFHLVGDEHFLKDLQSFFSINLSIEELLGMYLGISNIEYINFPKSKIINLLRNNYDESRLKNHLNYARFYIHELLDSCIKKIIYLDSDIIFTADIVTLWNTDLENYPVAMSEFCDTKIGMLFNDNIWHKMSKGIYDKNLLKMKKKCYFNPGVIIVDLIKWVEIEATKQLEYWMNENKKHFLWVLGSLPPYLLVFVDNYKKIHPLWNYHDLGCECNAHKKAWDQSKYSEPFVLHWSCKDKPWNRKRSCWWDHVWRSYYDIRKKGMCTMSRQRISLLPNNNIKNLAIDITNKVIDKTKNKFIPNIDEYLVVNKKHHQKSKHKKTKKDNDQKSKHNKTKKDSEIKVVKNDNNQDSLGSIFSE